MKTKSPSLELLVEKIPTTPKKAADRIRELRDDVLKAFDNYVLHGYNPAELVRQVLYTSGLTNILGQRLSKTMVKNTKTPKQLASYLLRKSSVRGEKTINCYNIRTLFSTMLKNKTDMEYDRYDGSDYNKTLQYTTYLYHTMVEMIKLSIKKRKK